MYIHSTQSDQICIFIDNQSKLLEYEINKSLYQGTFKYIMHIVYAAYIVQVYL